MSHIDVLTRNTFMTLATVCEDGSPWNTPITFVFHDSAIYWRSSEAAVHSQNIARDGRVSISVFDHERPSPAVDREAVYIQSIAEQVVNDDKDTLLAEIGDKFSIKDAAVPLYKASVGVIDTGKSTDSRFYSFVTEGSV